MAAAATADPGPYGVYNVAGPMLAGGFGQMTLLGLLFAQTQSFFEDSNDGSAIKCLVVFVNLVALAQGCFTFENWWRAFVQNFGTVATNLEFADEMQPVMTALMSVPVHAYFVTRCYQATGKSKMVLAILGSLILTTLAAGVFVSVGLVSAHQGVDNDSDPPPVNVAVVILLVVSAVLDVLITAILLSFLIRSRAKGCSQYLHGLIDSLITLVWSCAAPPCVCAMAACIAYLVSYGQGTPSLWAYLPGDLLGLLYGLALMVTLNSRPEAERMRCPAFDSDETIPGQILNCPLARNALIRIEAGHSADIVGVDIAHVIGEVDSLGGTPRVSSMYERPVGADSRPSVTYFGKPKRELA